MTRIKQALLQHGPCEASSAPLLSATAELPFCQADGAGRLRARHRRRMCSCKSKSKKQAAHRVRKVRQDVGNRSVRVLFAVAVAWLCASMSAGSSAQYQTPATSRVVIREPGTFARSGGVLRLRGWACETRPCRLLSRAAKLRSAAPDTATPTEEGSSAPTAAWGCEQDGRSYCLPSHAHLHARLRGGGHVFAAPSLQGVTHQVASRISSFLGCAAPPLHLSPVRPSRISSPIVQIIYAGDAPCGGAPHSILV